MCIYKNHTYIHTHTHHVFFIHSSIDGGLGCFYMLAIVKKKNKCCNEHRNYRYLFEMVISLLLDVHPEVKLLDSMIVLVFILGGSPYSSPCSFTNLHSHQQYSGFLSHILTSMSSLVCLLIAVPTGVR